jgi:cellulose synthase/poly-beta-1,6-N-acetylglucosamine synthase-like glycosyltransferase
MAAVLESSFLRQRLRQLDTVNFHANENSRLGQCDCTSYSYLVLGTMLLSVGTVITVLAAGETHEYVFYTLGHMWLVGPIFICSGLMVLVKSILYLRKKYLLQMLLRQRSLWRVRQICIIMIITIYANIALLVVLSDIVNICRVKRGPMKAIQLLKDIILCSVA